MALLDSKMQNLSLTLINKFGKSNIELLTYNTDFKTVDTSKTITMKGFIDTFEESDYQNKTIIAGDIKLLVDYLSSGVIDMKNKIKFDSKVYKIMAIDPVYSGDNIALYELQLRK
jgi:hypothetical protein